jgi:hypothetical protein
VSNANDSIYGCYSSIQAQIKSISRQKQFQTNAKPRATTVLKSYTCNGFVNKIITS